MGSVTRPPLIAAKMTIGAVVTVPLVGVTVSQFPSEVATADVNWTVPLEVVIEIGISEIPWPGSVQKTREPGLKLSVPLCAVAGTVEASAIRAMAIRGGVTFAELLKDFSRRESTAPTLCCVPTSLDYAAGDRQRVGWDKLREPSVIGTRRTGCTARPRREQSRER